MEFNPNNLAVDDDDYVDREGRKRHIKYGWPRIPNGRVLEKHRAPHGFRTPNALVWGHSCSEICWIARLPGVDGYVTTYSRSQIKDLGENYKDDEWDEPLCKPRIRRPWPVLKLPPRHPAQPDPPLGAIDVGCSDAEHSESEFKTYNMRWDDPELGHGSGKHWLGVPVVVEPRKCSTDPAVPCLGRLVANDGPEPLKNGHGHPYHYLWCEHFVARMKEQKDPIDLVARTIHLLPDPRVFGDIQGVYMLSESDNWCDFNPSLAKAEPVYTLNDAVVVPAGTVLDNNGFPRDPANLNRVIIRTDIISGSGEDILMGDDKSVPTPSSSSSSMPQVPQEQKEQKEQKEAKEAKEASAPDLFSVTDLPKLEEFIPESLFPDVLLVHDPDRATNHQQLDGEPVKYRRVWPKLGDADKEVTKELENVAHLHLLKANRFGEGHHSYVYRAPLTLPPPLSARSRTGQCTVAAKLAYSRCTAHRLLRNEGKVYNSLPKHTQEEYCGVNIVPPCRFPVPVGAIAPKFFGYYLPVDEDGKVVEHHHDSCDEETPCRVDWVSPILLMEECGKPVVPKKFTTDQRTECFSLILRLHELNILQGSFYVRNVMIQPGPLIFPPEKRTFDRPSFRLIDFGRGECFETGEKMSKEEVTQAMRGFNSRVRDEQRGARQQLLVEDVIGF